ncbi:ATP-NAD kinase family protein [Agromyces tardus]|nr:NAD(+)/NADH kinase [Agromyces tardus]
MRSRPDVLGLIVNPVAGVGGPAGLAGSDGADVQRLARERGARSRADERASAALAVVAASHPNARVLTVAGAMGEHAVRAAGLEPVVVAQSGEPTSAADTAAAARALAAAGATLVLFAGGDGTARDVATGLALAGRAAPPEATRIETPGDEVEGLDTLAGARYSTGEASVDRVARSAYRDLEGGGLDTLAGARYSTGEASVDRVARSVYRDLEGGGLDTLAGARCSTGEVAALGIPAGVKMYSPAFAVSPSAAGALAAAWLTEGSLPTQLREVLDVDEAALRRARVEPRLYGMLRVPDRPGRTQARKSATSAGEHAAVRAAAHGAADRMERGIRYLLGPGGTMAELARELGVAKTPLGVDVVLDGELVLAGASEQQLLDEVRRGPAKAVVSIIGGQGFLLGRGNQQLSARVVGELGADPLLVVAPEQKLIDLGGRPLLVDTGDRDVDAGLAGFIRVVTGPASTSLYPVHAPEHEGEGHAP